MSIFSESKIVIPATEVVTQIAISNAPLLPLLALSTSTRILFFNESGEKIEMELYKGLTPTYIEFHPILPQLAIGWQNGGITLFNEDQKMVKEDTAVHKAAVILIVYQSSGNCMVSTDEKGLVAVWRGINCISSYQREGAITNCIFCELNFPDKEGQKLKTSNLFFFGGKSGVVCLADSSNHCSEVCKVGGSIKSLLFYEKENSVIIITSTLLLVQFKISPNEKTAPDKKVKLSIAGDPEKLSSIWIGACLLSTCSHENMLRFWHLENDENYVLTLFDVEQAIGGLNTFSDKIVAIRYENKGRVLIGGTKEGKVLFWKNQGLGNSSPTDSDQWKPMPFLSMSASINQIISGSNNGLIAVRSGNNVSLVSETVVNGKASGGLKILQTASNKVQVYFQNDIVNQIFLFTAKNNIKSLDCCNNNIVIWTGKKVEVYEIVSNLQDGSTKLVEEFTEKCVSVGIHNENIILMKERMIQTTSFKGIVKQSLNFAESEGQLLNFNILNNFMVMFTSNNFMKTFDISRKEYKQIGITRRFEDSTGPLGDIKSCVVNANGSKIGILSSPKKGTIETKFFIYDLEMDSFMSYDFGPNRVPVCIMWDKNDQRFFIVQTSYLSSGNKQESEKQKKPDDSAQLLPNAEFKFNEEWKGEEINTFFCTSETGIKRQDSFRTEADFEGLFGLVAPKIFFIYRSQENDASKNFKIHEETLKDFSGIDKIDDSVVKSIMNFSFNLTTGNMDEAYKSVKSIQNPIIWENMAQMCVKTKRLDVAEICIGNMRFARGARAIRESKNEDQLEAKLAMVAIQLNMKTEAENLYKSCKRYDLINKMYQASGEWDKAIKIAETHDRINLKTTYYKTAKLLEISRDFEKAIYYYEKSGTHRKEVPRMLMCNNKIKMLENYIEEKKDKELYKWWAQYLESNEKFEQSLNFYKLAEDFSSIVRLLIFQGDLNRAKEVCKETNDIAACYYLAKQMELKDAIEEAVTFYAMAQYYSQAVKLARERGLENEIMSLSLKSPVPVMLQSAAYFEAKGHNEKAVILYMKGRNLKKALDIAVKAKLYDYVKKITAEINPDANNDMLDKLSKVFLDGNQNEQAVHLLIASKQIEKALELCIQNNIAITEDIVKKMIPASKPENSAEEKKRQDLIRLISKKAKKQGNFELASKYYIELGEKVKAIKCLIKLGDLERVITFANNARIIEIYILAANYLQTADWHKNPDIIKYIITFYNKAKAFDRLANFYDECAGVEIDEYRDYEKALSALKDAFKYAQKSTAADKDAKAQQLQQKIFFVEKFIQSKQILESHPQEMLKICQQLVENPNVESAIRAGDVYAQMIEYYHSIKEFKSAFTLIQKMQDKGIILNPYLDQGIIEDVYTALGKTSAKKQKIQQEEEVENFQEEELLE